MSKHRWLKWLCGRQLDAAVLSLSLLIGGVLRSLGYWREPISLWLDEAEWAVRLLTTPLLDQAIRPIGYLWLTRTLAELFGPYEQVLRLVSFVGGILTIALSYFCARLLFKERLPRLLAPMLFALHPLLIDFSKEFKPYSVEVTCHLLIVLTSLRYLQLDSAAPPKQRWLRLSAALSTPVVCFPLAYNVILTYPAVFLLLLLRTATQNRAATQNHAATQNRNAAQEHTVTQNRGGTHRRYAQSITVIGAAGVALCLALVLQFKVLSHVDSHSYGPEYWGKKYGVFLMPDRSTWVGPQPAAALEWLSEKLCEMAELGGFSATGWQLEKQSWLVRELQYSYEVVFLVACVLGLLFTSKKQLPKVALLVSPVAVMVVFNALGRWPLGAFRVNLFATAYSLLLALYGVDRLLQSVENPRNRMLLTGVLASILLVPRVSFSAPPGTVKETRPWMGHTHLRAALRILDESQTSPNAPKASLLADYYTYNSLEYYQKIHPTFSVTHPLSHFRVTRFLSAQDLDKRLRRLRGDAWVMVSMQGLVHPSRQTLKKHCARVEERDLGKHHLLAYCEHKR